MYKSEKILNDNQDKEDWSDDDDDGEDDDCDSEGDWFDIEPVYCSDIDKGH